MQSSSLTVLAKQPDRSSWERCLSVVEATWRFSGQAYPSMTHQSWTRLRRRVRWCACALIQFRNADLWFKQLEQPPLKPFVHANPRLALRPMASYMAISFNWEQRARLIADTYRFLQSESPFLGQAMQSETGKTWMSPTWKEGSLKCWIGSHPRFRKEGEITVELSWNEVSLGAFAFSVAWMPGLGGWCMRIGALQGRALGSEQVKAFTRQLHGLRPKDLCVRFIQFLAQHMGMKAVLGISNEEHIYASKSDSQKTSKRLSFDYTELWKEHGGIALEDGWYQLPLPWQPKPADAIKPNKRSLYARRHALLAQIEAFVTRF